MDLATDFDEFFECLIAHGVEFIVVGAYALAYHGAPRFTGDVDILVRPTLDNATRVIDALETFGFPVASLTATAIVDRRALLEMGLPPVQIHVMSTISGVEWDEAWADHVQAPLGKHTVALLGRKTFIQNKRAAGRVKDLADIDALESGTDS